MNLDQILKECDLFDQLKEKATGGEWRAQVQEHCKDWYEILSPGAPGMDIAKVAPWSGHVEANAKFIAQAHNWDSTFTIRQLLSQVKVLTEALNYYALEGSHHLINNPPGSVTADKGHAAREALKKSKEMEK